jgi:hypothetical protein
MFDCGGANAGRQAWALDSSGRIMLVAPSTTNALRTADDTIGHGISGISRISGISDDAPVVLCLNVGPKIDPVLKTPLAQLEPCSAASTQQMALPSPAGAQGTIRNSAAGTMCLDVSNHDKKDGAPVGFYPCTPGGAANQMWTVQDTPAHTVQFIVKETGKCLTAC